ncbi:hypothetical protein MRB53_002907 [Persea americana]|uniref:Uncharacterized protein n=1 Tax=Persea americana TaxID=3435 RepID=A0ACC2MW40_PERAE|nr:hypothetical protein MRB53_002907 [Persea americana]
MKKIESTAKKGPRKGRHLKHSHVTTLFPSFEKSMGSISTYSTGKEPLLYVSHPDMGMVDLIVECTIPMLKSWEHRIDSEGEVGIGDVRVDEDLKCFSAFVISRACFGSSYSNGEEIFSRLRAIRHEMAKAGILLGIPGWSKGGIESNAGNSFTMDNYKSIYFAGHESTAVSATWGLMLLALNPEWQARARAEVSEVCGGQLPDADMLRRMKVVFDHGDPREVIHETMRLFPTATLVPREALQEMKLGEVHIPKGTNFWIPVPTLHREPEIWGPSAQEFDPGRFSNGIIGACKFPHMYIPFGMGARICPGQNLTMAELSSLSYCLGSPSPSPQAIATLLLLEWF